MTAGNRIHAVTNHRSGVVGELRVASELMRCGYRVAKPYWTEDEADLIVFPVKDCDLYITVQSKSVQFSHDQGAIPPNRYISGLKKKYLSNNKWLSLAVYLPEFDDIYFVDGAEKIISIYANQNHQKPYDTLEENDEVTITVKYPDGIGIDWKVPKDNATWLTQRISGLADKVKVEKAEIQGLSTFGETKP